MSSTPDFPSRFTKALIAHAPTTAGAADALRGAIEDAVSRPGHLTRAALVVEAATAHHMPRNRAEQLACAVEYWHLASLVLDDLPCMDDAKERRGRPCTHQRFGEATAILTSLALINRAYTLVQSVFATKPLTIRRQAIALVDRVLGPFGLVGGQAHDLAFALGEKKPRETGRIAWQKTGTLLWLCVALPSLWSKSSARTRRALRRLSVYWGLAYQGIDDLRDVLSSSIAAGKTSQRDATLNRPNLALALGVPAAHQRVQRLLALAARSIDDLTQRDPRYRYLSRWHVQVFVARELALCAA
jgi:geranylgeranyl pyrophosphate synthase